MQRITLMLSLIILLIFPIDLSAQDEIVSVTLYYDISPMANYGVEAVDELVEAANEQLDDYGVEITTERGSVLTQRLDNAIFLSAFSNFTVEGEEVTHIHLQARNFDVERLSPILRSNYTLSYQPDVLSDDIIIALALYNASYFDDVETMLLNNFAETSTEGIHFYIGNIKLIQEDYQVGLDYFGQIETRTVNDKVDVVANSTWSLLNLNRQDEAFAIVNNELSEWAEQSGFQIALTVIRAQLYALTFDYDSAIADMDSAIVQASEAGYGNFSLAELYTQRGEIIFLIYEWDRVEDNFDTAIELDPTYSPAYFQRGVLFYTMARREDALSDFEMYLELEPDGIYAEDAESYIESIEIELEALNG